MKKLIILFSVLVSLLTVTLILFLTFKENDIEEKTFSIKTSYAYLSKGSVGFNIRLYTNNKNSLLTYSNEATTTLHDKKEEVVVGVEVVEVYHSSTTTYQEETYYEYTLQLKVDITKLEIDECYLTLKFTNKAYTFNIGSVEIKENIYEENILKITDLYGVSSSENISLAAIIITINNTTETDQKITNISIGNNYEIVINDSNKTTVKPSIKIEDYYDENNENSTTYLSVDSNNKNTYILPIKYLKDYYLYNCYLLIDCNGITYYLSNFNYINSNDLEAQKTYLLEGMIYDI